MNAAHPRPVTEVLASRPVSPGRFVVSLDLELFWGMFDVRTLESYRENLAGVRVAAARMLDLFREYDIHATWATVGFLFLNDMGEVRARRPEIMPDYERQAFSPFAYADRVGTTAARDLHFAPDLISKILATPGQELATHTFSHFYCLEAPRSIPAFKSDIQAALAVAKERFDATLTSIVFPRNQYSEAHVQAAGELGITAYRGNPGQWMYQSGALAEESARSRLARLVDAYVPIAGDTSFSLRPNSSARPLNVPASRFLRPWSTALRWADDFRVRRIMGEIESAAIAKRVYHLWWHPHNFGRHPAENIASLRVILDCFARARDAYGMTSKSMRELATDVSVNG